MMKRKIPIGLSDFKKMIEEKPLEMKKQLGILLIALETKSLEQGQIERENFERKFAKKELTDDDFIAIQTTPGAILFDVLLPHFASKSELRRLFEQKAVKNSDTDEVLVIDVIATDINIRVGKRNFFKVMVR